MSTEEVQVQEITYFRAVKPPTLAQYLYRRAVKEEMAKLKGQTGVTVNPETNRPVPVSALSVKATLKGLTAEKILKEHPEWEGEYEQYIREWRAGTQNNNSGQ